MSVTAKLRALCLTFLIRSNRNFDTGRRGSLSVLYQVFFLSCLYCSLLFLNDIALAALAGSQLRTSNQNRNQQQTNRQQHEMTVPNDLIGCIIGKGGTKIAEIRQISGAMIRISNCEEREGGNTDRTITISGNPDSVAVAQYLINMR